MSTAAILQTRIGSAFDLCPIRISTFHNRYGKKKTENEIGLHSTLLDVFERIV